MMIDEQHHAIPELSEPTQVATTGESSKIDVPTKKIDLEKLSAYTTEEVVQAAIKDSELAKKIIIKFLEPESQKYRRGKNVRPETKIMQIISRNTASESDFTGRPVRDDLTQKELDEIVKPSEADELVNAIAQWFGEQQAVWEEIKTLETQRQIFIKLLTLSGIDDDFYQEIEQALENLARLINEKNNLEFELISEIADIFYNLIQLTTLDRNSSHVYEYWIKKFCSILEWSLSEALAITIAKYHHRFYGGKGKDKHGEYQQISLITNGSRPEDYDSNKIPFPVNGKLRKLRMYLAHIRAVYNNQSEISEETAKIVEERQAALKTHDTKKADRLLTELLMDKGYEVTDINDSQELLPVYTLGMHLNTLKYINRVSKLNREIRVQFTPDKI